MLKCVFPSTLERICIYSFAYDIGEIFFSKRWWAMFAYRSGNHCLPTGAHTYLHFQQRHQSVGRSKTGLSWYIGTCMELSVCRFLFQILL